MDELETVNNKLKSNPSVDDYEDLYTKEYYLSMRLVDIHENIHLLLDGVEDEDQLTIKRLRKEADRIFAPIAIELGRHK